MSAGLQLNAIKRHTLVNVLIYSLSMADLGGRERMYRESQVRNSGLAHLLLVRNGGNGEFTRLLLKQGERGDFCFLCVRLAIDAIPTMMDQTTNNEEKKDRM